MRTIKHGLKSIIRRPIKTTMLFLIFLVVFNLVFTGVITQNSITSSKNYIRNQIGGVVEYQLDYTKFYQDMQNGTLPEGTEMPPISLEQVQAIGDNEYVLKTYFTNSIWVNAEIESVANEDGGGPIFERSDLSAAKSSILPMGYFTITGINQPDSVGMNIGKETLIDGDLFTQDHLNYGEHVIFISEDLATLNNLVVGDPVAFTKSSWTSEGEVTEDFTFIVQGIYQTTDSNKNKVYAPFSTVDALEEKWADYFTGTAFFLVEDPLNIDAFKSDVQDSMPDYHKLYSNDAEYEQLTAPLDLVSLISNLLTWVVLAAGILIIASIVTIFVRDRKFEIGLLLSSGEGKVKIVTQFVFEIALIAVITFGVSTLTSSIISGEVSTWIAETQLISEKPDDIWIGGWTNPLYGDINMEDVQEQFNAAIDASTLLNMFLINIGLIIFSSLVPLTAIMSFKPRKILQD